MRERHPETGANGNGWIDYTRDARGNVLLKDVPNSTSFDLLYTYDPAGRPIFVEEMTSSGPRVLKEFSYSYANKGANLSKGKMVRSKRHHYPPESG